MLGGTQTLSPGRVRRPTSPGMSPWMHPPLAEAGGNAVTPPATVRTAAHIGNPVTSHMPRRTLRALRLEPRLALASYASSGAGGLDMKRSPLAFSLLINAMAGMAPEK